MTTRRGASSKMAHETPPRTMAAATVARVSDADTDVGGRRCMPPRVASRPSKERLLMGTLPSVAIAGRRLRRPCRQYPGTGRR